MEKEIKGIPVREKIEKTLSEDISKLKTLNIVPKVATIRVGTDSGQIFYEKAITKRADKYGILTENIVFDEYVNEEVIEEKIRALNEDNDIHGIIVFMPLPKHIDSMRISSLISPSKDIDAITDISYARLLSGRDRENTFFACTAESCMEILKNNGYDVSGKRVTIFGRSLRVGKPLMLMMMNDNATVTVCHTKTLEEDAISLSKNADIVILATGNTGGYDRRFFKDGQIVVDVGTGAGKDGKIAGDLNVSDLMDSEIDIRYTPVPGGVGAVTTTILLRNVVKAARNNIKNI